MIKIAIADDQILLRDMLKVMLKQESELDVLGWAGNGNWIIEICHIHKPDVILMDIRMPEMDGIEALSNIKKKYPEVKVIMLTTFEDEDSIYKAFKYGADGYVLKDVKPELLILTVKCIYEGLFVMNRSIHNFMINKLRTEIAETVTVSTEANESLELDKVDINIIKLLADGCNNKEIAERINFAEGTVKNRISKILGITGLKDRTQIAVFALKNNII